MFRKGFCCGNNDMSDNGTNFLRQNEANINVDVNMMSMGPSPMMGNMGQPQMGLTTQPIIEPIQERVVNRTIMHEVPQVSPFL